MSASVPGCGHACHYLEVDHLADAPQVHVHFLTDAEEFAFLGYFKVELCCHGCGESSLVYYNEAKKGDTRHMQLRNEFERKHRCCENRGYDKTCPNYRSSFATIDLRPGKSRRRRGGVSRPQEGRTGVGTTPRESLVGFRGPYGKRKEATKSR